MKKNFPAAVLVFALLLSGCSAIGRASGMVPSEDLEAANARVAELESQLTEKDTAVADRQAELDAVSAQVSELESQLSVLEEANEGLTSRNADLETLICSERDWADFWSKSGFLRPEAWFDPSYKQAFLDMQQVWDFVPEMTQWQPPGDWRPDMLGYLVVWDGQSMVWSVDEHCLIMDPTVYRDLGR